MSRRNTSKKKYISPDPIYNSKIISKLINTIMKNGKKSIAQKILYTTMNNIEKANNLKAIEITKKAIENITPVVEIKARRIGGAIYQIPTEINKERGNNIALKILIRSARKRNGKSMVYKLQNEIMDAYNNIGNAVKKKEEMHKMAEANKVFTTLKL